jgi:SulP family sulfate permease
VLGRLGRATTSSGIGAHADVRAVPGVLILRPEEPLFFANVEAVLDSAAAQLAAASSVHTLVLSLEESPNLDGTCIEVLGQFAATSASAMGARCGWRASRNRCSACWRSAALPGLPESALSGSSVDAVVATVVGAR